MSFFFQLSTYNSNYVSKTYITFQEKMWTEFVRAYIQIQKRNFPRSPEYCMFENDNNISGLFVNRLKTKKEYNFKNLSTKSK